MSETPATEAKPAAPGGANKLTLIVAVVVAALASGGGTYLATHRAQETPAAEAATKGKTASHAKKAGAEAEGEDASEDQEAAPAEEEGEAAHVVALPSFLVNLGEDTQEMHYLKITVSLEAPNEEAGKMLESKGPKIRNNVLMYLSGLKLEDTQGNEKRQQILKRIRAEVRHVVSPKLCQGVYMTEFVVQ